MADQEIDLNVPVVPVAAAMPLRPGQATNVPSSPFPASNYLGPEQLRILQQQGFPSGLAKELGNTRASYPLRFWIVDNSGSMRSTDGKEIRGTKERIQEVSCNRWTELQGAVEYHAELAGLIQATTIFRMLNDPGVLAGPQEFSVADSNSAATIEQDVEQAKNVIRKSEPKGVTPLTEHLTDIRNRIESVEHSLRSQGQQAVLVIATDGLPSNKYGESTQVVQTEFVNALRDLQNLPVWVVVRLCTNDDEVVEYYNNLDSILELPLEVIDDLWGEAQEIHSANKWLNYALPLHRAREMGFKHRIFDLLDERLLNKDELQEFMVLVFGQEAMAEAPDIHSDWKGFVHVLTRVMKSEGKEYNPVTKKLDWWIDIKQLERCYGGGFRLFGKKK